VVDVLVEDERLLSLLFSLLERPPPLDPSVVSYFRKVLQVLIQRKYAELVAFCAAHGVLDRLLRHLGLYSVLELIIMLGWDSGLMEGQIEQRWMLAQGLIPKLVRRLHPQYQSLADVHAHAGRLLVDVVVKCPLAHASPLVQHLSTTPIHLTHSALPSPGVPRVTPQAPPSDSFISFTHKDHVVPVGQMMACHTLLHVCGIDLARVAGAGLDFKTQCNGQSAAAGG